MGIHLDLASTRGRVKILCYLTFSMIFIVQCSTILNEFLKYPFIIDMYDKKPNVILDLPGVTICSNNRLSLKKLLNRNPQLKRIMERRFPEYTIDKKPQTGVQFHVFRDGVYKVFMENDYFPEKELENSTLNGGFNLKPEIDDLVKRISCSKTWTESIECDSITRIESLQERVCTTILHQGAIQHDLVNRPYLFNASAGKFEDYFDVKERIRIVVDFEPEDYADLKRQIGARITFHSNDYVPSSEDLDMFITRGYRYDFTLEREDMLLLERPYGDCYNYEVNLPKYDNEVNPRVPLMSQGCFQNCVIRNMIHSFNCWPPSIPYYRNDTLDPERKLKACSWAEDRQFFLTQDDRTSLDDSQNDSGTSHSARDNKTINRIDMMSYMKVKRFCWTQCALHCRGTKNMVTMTRSRWPSEVKTLLDKTGNDSLMNHCCALITVKNMRYVYRISHFVPKYNLPDTFSNIGGLLAVWLSLSMVSVYHAIQKLVEICRERSLKKLEFKITTKAAS